MARIIGHEYPINKIFSPEFDFFIPTYQRPYAWTTEEAGELFEDILGFMQQQGATGPDDPYFLGSIVLIKAEESPRAEVIDGHQRLATLTLLLAALVCGLFWGGMFWRIGRLWPVIISHAAWDVLIFVIRPIQ